MTAASGLPSSSGHSARDRWVTAAAIVGVAALLTLADATQTYVAFAGSRNPMPFHVAVLDRVPSWMIVALLSPLVLMFADRFPLERARLSRGLVIHLAGALTFAFLHLLLRAVYTATMLSAWDRFPIWLNKSAFIALDILTYAAIIGGWHALRYHREVKAREVAEAKLREGLTEARLAALRSQLNPHFLFNTLNAISTMALKREHDSVVLTLGHLGDLLRVSLDDELPQEVSLGDELELLDRYLEIQRIRFGDRLTIRHDVDVSVIDAMVPSMLLQPLVENAIAHGVAPVPGPGNVCIHAERRGDVLVLEVSDSGPGFGDTPRTGNGIGLTNTRARLAQLYGSAHDVSFGTARGARSGGRVTVSIPFRSALTSAPRSAS